MTKKRIIIGRTAYVSYNTPPERSLKKEIKSQIIDLISKKKRKITKLNKIILIIIGLATALSATYILLFLKFLFVLF